MNLKLLEISKENITYFGTETEKCKVDKLINSQYIVLTVKDFNLKLSLKYANFDNKTGNFLIKVKPDTKFYVYNKNTKKGDKYTLEATVAHFNIKTTDVEPKALTEIK